MLLLLNGDIQAQTAGSRIWYFGSNAGVDFTVNPPVAITNGSLVTDEGCAAVSDPKGNLFFYTDGRSVFNKTHGTMANGTGLNGDPSSTQSAVTVADPGNIDRYYLFTVDAFAGAKGLCYSIIDMSKNGGLGQVTNKNTLLRTPVCEKITAVRKPYSPLVWIIARGWNNDSFYVYKLDSFGCKFYRSQSIGSAVSGTTGNSAGYLKANIAGTKVAYASYMGFAEIFDFDPQNGVFSNPIKINGLGSVYGVEFSKNNRFLYLSNGSQKKIWQYDISLSSAAAVIASETLVSNYTSGNGGYGMQMGPDGKIYLAVWTSDYLSCISSPDSAGTKCGFIQKAVDLKGKLSKAGLPNALNSDNFTPFTDFTYTAVCAGDVVQFDDTIDFVHDSVIWYFGVSKSGQLGTSNKHDPSFQFPSGDFFDVKLVVYLKSVRVDSAMKRVFMPKPIYDTAGIAICTGDSILIGNTFHKTAGVYAATLKSYRGCDSFLTVNLSLLKTSATPFTVTDCPGSTYNFNQQTITSPGIYTQKLKNYLGCDSTVTLDYKYFKPATSDIYDTICYGSNIVFNGQTYSQPGNYIQILKSKNNCDSTITLHLFRQAQLRTVLYDTFCHKDSFVFFGQELRQAGVYNHMLSSGNCDSLIVLNLAVKLCSPVMPCLVHFPSAFTPDENNINDDYKPVYDCNITKYELRIYNRWGQEVYATEKAAESWDGTFGGKPVPQGMYVYRADLTAEQSLEPEKHRYEGTILLLR